MSKVDLRKGDLILYSHLLRKMKFSMFNIIKDKVDLKPYLTPQQKGKKGDYIKGWYIETLPDETVKKGLFLGFTHIQSVYPYGEYLLENDILDVKKVMVVQPRLTTERYFSPVYIPCDYPYKFVAKEWT